MSKTETQSDVQRYATLLEKYVKGASLPDFQEDMVLEAAAYLRRLDAENKALRSAIGDACEGWNMHPDLRKLLEAALWAKPEAAAKNGGAA